MVFIESWFWLKPAGLQRLNKHVRRLFARNRPFCIIWEDLSGYWDCSAEGLKPEAVRVKHERPLWLLEEVGSAVVYFQHLWAKSSKLLSRDFQRTINRKESSGRSCNEDDENHVVQVGGSHRLFLLPPSLLGLVCEEGNPSIVLSDFPVFPVSQSQPESAFPFCHASAAWWSWMQHHFTAHMCAPLWANQCVDRCVRPSLFWSHHVIDQNHVSQRAEGEVKNYIASSKGLNLTFTASFFRQH